MKRSLCILAAIGCLSVLSSSAFGQVEKSLNRCSKTVGKEELKYVQQYIKAVSGCMNKIATELIQSGDPIADAAKTCQRGFRKLVNSVIPAKALAARMTGKIAASCDPAVNPQLPAGLEAEILGNGMLPQQIEAMNLDNWCTFFGGDGSIDDLDEWVTCLNNAATCGARQELATAYPRLLEWLNAMRPAIMALDPTCTSSCASCARPEIKDACNALEAVEAAVDGNTDDDLPDLKCGPGLLAGVDSILPKTGQTTCWNSSGVVVACAGTGHDGDVQAGQAKAFVNNGNGTISDDSTGLVWEVKCDGALCPTIHDKDTSYMWADAFAVHVATLNNTCDGDNVTSCTQNSPDCDGIGNGLCGHGGSRDWRVPNLLELETIWDLEQSSASPPTTFAAFDACAPNCNVTSCSCTAADFYWSSTTFASGPTTAWAVDLSAGVLSSLSKIVSRRVRAVRGGF